MPAGGVDRHAIDGTLAIGRGEGLSDELDIGGVAEIHLAGTHVLELGMVVALLRNDLTTDEEDTIDLKVGLSTEHADLSESVLSEVIKSLHETLKQVSELVLDLTLVSVSLVVEPPEGVSFAIDLLHELLVALASLVGVVHEEGLEVEQIEAGRRQSIKWVDVLLGSVLTLGLGGGLLLLLLGLLLDLKDRLERLLGHLDLAEESDELRDGSNAVEPGASLGCSLGESLIKDELEGHGELGTEDDVSNSGVGTTGEPFTRESLVDSTEVLLEALDGVVELRLGHIGLVAEDGVDGGHTGLDRAADAPVEPLVDESALDLAGSEKGGVAVGKELGNGVALLEVALRGHKKRELVGWVELLIALLSASLLRVDDKLGFFASDLADNTAHVDKDVSCVLGVDFLQEAKQESRVISKN